MEYSVCLVSRIFGATAKKIDKVFTLPEFVEFLETINGKRTVASYQKIHEGVGICRIANGNPYLISDDPTQWNEMVATVMQGANGALMNKGLMREFSKEKIDKASQVIYR